MEYPRLWPSDALSPTKIDSTSLDKPLVCKPVLILAQLGSMALGVVLFIYSRYSFLSTLKALTTAPGRFTLRIQMYHAYILDFLTTNLWFDLDVSQCRGRCGRWDFEKSYISGRKGLEHSSKRSTTLLHKPFSTSTTRRKTSPAHYPVMSNVILEWICLCPVANEEQFLDTDNSFVLWFYAHRDHFEDITKSALLLIWSCPQRLR